MSFAIHFATAIVYGTLAWLLWFRAMPPMLVKRGWWPSLGIWLLGMALALFVTGKLELALDGAPLRWSFVAGDFCLMANALFLLARSRALGPFAWGRCPDEVEQSVGQ